MEIIEYVVLGNSGRKKELFIASPSASIKAYATYIG